MNEEVLEIIDKSKHNHNTKNGLFLEKYINYYNMKVKDNYILYQSFDGQGIIDNPYALFKAFMKRKDFMDFTHIWVINNFENKDYQILEYSSYPNVIFVQYSSDDYLKYLSTAKYLINNCTFPSYFTKKDEQIYINTWHGKTRKKLGFDVPNSKFAMANTIRNFLSCDYILSGDDHMTNVYKYSYKLDGLYEGYIIQEGHPRNDLRYSNKLEVINKLSYYGIKIESGKKVVLYAPTWDGTLNNPKKIDYDKIINAVDKSKYQILCKAHHVYKDKRFIPCEIDTNELLTVCDILITDYSSIAYDFMIMNKPVIYYIPDHESYMSSHGLCDDFECNVAYNIETLKAYLRNTEKLNIAYYYEPLCADKILRIILDGEKGNVFKLTNNKIKLLFYVGDFKFNGVTTSFMSLVENIDYSKFDVSLIVLNKKDDLYVKTINRINDNVRILCRSGTYAQTLLEECAKDITLKFGIGTDYLNNLLPREMYKREFRRCFGNSKFDKLINFTGYSPFYSYLFICNDGEKIIWQHNDMIADQNRINGNGLKPLYDPLNAVFSTYKYYDRIISASEEIMFKNIENFSDINRNKFYYAHNTLDYNRIIELSNEHCDIAIDKNKINFINNARLSYAKNQKNLILAFNDFANKHNDCELYIVGDGELKEELLSIAGEHVHLVGFKENPYALMKQCDYFIFPSIYEGQGISLLEARVLNLPIVVSNLPRMKGIFIKGGQYNIGGFSKEHILKGLNACYKNNVKRKYFDYDLYNKEAYREFEESIL